MATPGVRSVAWPQPSCLIVGDSELDTASEEEMTFQMEIHHAKEKQDARRNK
jgi:hypothetical protein